MERQYLKNPSTGYIEIPIDGLKKLCYVIIDKDSSLYFQTTFHAKFAL